jgi:hypothetical protein
MRAAKLLLDKGELPDDLTKEALRVAAAGVVVATMGRLFSDEEQLAALRDFVRAAATVATRSAPLASAMLARVCYLGPADVTDTIRRLVHDEKVQGWEAISKLSTEPAALAKADAIVL